MRRSSWCKGRRRLRARQVRAAPSEVGTHEQNRDGLGLNCRDVLDLVTAIMAVGFNYVATNPIAAGGRVSSAACGGFESLQELRK